LVIGIMIGLAAGRHAAKPAPDFAPVKMLYWVWPETVRTKGR
jgi:hypothetical protein